MKQSGVALEPGVRMRPFPRSGGPVLLPLGDQLTASLGVTMYPACRRVVILGQRVAAVVFRCVPARWVPGSTEAFVVPSSHDDWRAMVRQWEAVIGPLRSFAAYRRRQSHRAGLTILALGQSGVSAGVIKLRPDSESLFREQEALSVVERFRPRAFKAPKALGRGSHGEWHWSIQEVVFKRPHAPVLDEIPGLFAEIRESLASVVPLGTGEPSHGDVSPWNLRRDTHGQVWLYDWEDVGRLPAGSDRTYFVAAAHALGGRPVPDGLSRGAIEHWRRVIEERQRLKAPGVTLPDRTLAALDVAARTAV